jgi:hypothetical protein
MGGNEKEKERRKKNKEKLYKLKKVRKTEGGMSKHSKKFRGLIEVSHKYKCSLL